MVSSTFLCSFVCSTWNWKGYNIRYQYAGTSGPALVLIHGSASLPPPPTASSRACSQATFDLAGRRLLVLARPPDLQIEPNPSVIGPYESE
jgi:hypothetical protein